MSIILKGIDMPAEDEFIHVLITSNGNFGIISNKNVDIGFRKAIQIPKGHGRLIDMDDSIVFHGLNKENFEEYKRRIFEAHGILEAEEEE